MKQIPQTPHQISGWKRILFWFVIAVIPVIVLAATELFLRAINYDGDLDLVIKRRVGNHEVYSINRSVGLRYFGRSSPIIPEPSDDTFEIEKSDTTIRIFCLGESTMAGFPYEFNATAPSFLRDRMVSAFPHHRIEVVNVGLSAVGSYVVLDFLRELAHYQPDLFIVYVGHNEFYGAYGIGSTIGIGGNPTLTRLAIRLLSLKTFLALRDLISWIRGARPLPKGGSGTLMGEVVRNDAIPYANESYLTALRGYEENLQLMIDVSRDRPVPIVFSTLVSNVRNQPPFHADFSPSVSPSIREQWKKEVEQGRQSLAQKNNKEAIRRFGAAVSLDSTNAEGQFLLGSALSQSGDLEHAKQRLLEAKDLDQLRFRASEDFQRVLKTVCMGNRVPIARTDSVFEAETPSHIIGNELILEHLHPNIHGYFLMAKSFWYAMRSNNLILHADEWAGVHDQSDAEYADRSCTTTFDTLLGTIKIDLLTHRWPFVNTPTPSSFVPRDTVEQLVYDYVDGRTAWSTVRYQLSEYYLRHRQYDFARRECLAVSKVIPFSFQPLLRVADYYAMEGRKEEAAAAYRRCIAAEDNPFARVKLAILLLDGAKPGPAKEELGHALILSSAEGHPNPHAMATIYYLLAVAEGNLGDLARAKEAIQHSFSFVPNFPQSVELLGQIETVERNKRSPHK